MMKRLVSAKKLLVSTTAILAVGLSGQANAQEQGAEPELQDPNEIIVTANKRSENLQNVSISVSAVTGDSLEKGRTT